MLDLQHNSCSLPTLSHKDTCGCIDGLLRAVATCEASAAVWCEPGVERPALLVSLSGSLRVEHLAIAGHAAGFAFSSFVNPDGSETSFLPADLMYEPETDCWQIDPSLDPEKVASFAAVLKRSLENEGGPLDLLRGRDVLADSDDLSEHDFCQQVDAARAEISNGHLQKVVLARRLVEPLSAGVSPGAVFEGLRRMDQNGFISLISVADVGTWVGASPEVLIDQKPDGMLRTISLAGTQSTALAGGVENAAWTQKEIQEQAMVSRYIVNCFKRIRLREFEEHGPRTVQAGSLMHLRTEYLIDTNSLDFDDLPSLLLDLLHPTSAVCGMPVDAAHAFISEHEQTPRELYSGYLGPVNTASGTHLYVNLRCVRLGAESATFYSGAGITADSRPEDEWSETELKISAIRDVVRASVGTELD